MQSGVQDIESGSIRMIGAPGRFVSAPGASLFPGPSPDGKFCILTDGHDHYWLQPLDGGEAREIKGINPQERIPAWHGDSNNVFVTHSEGIDTEVYTLNLTSGERKHWTRFSLPEKTSIRQGTFIFITPDGSRFAYVVRKQRSTLFIAEGLR